jgi:tetratricopeptide (TPR) repeat protein
MYYAYTGQADLAQSHVQKMLELDPDLQEVPYYVARVALQRGDTDRAYEYLRATIDSGWGRDLILRDPDLVLRVGAERFEKL